MQKRSRNENPGEVLRRRLELIEEIYDLTKSQREAAQTEKWENLKAILDEKDRRIRQFEATERFVTGWKSLIVNAETTPSIKRVLEKIESRLAAVQSMEKECRSVLMNRKSKTARSLEELRRAKEGIRRFKSRGVRSPRFVDIRK